MNFDLSPEQQEEYAGAQAFAKVELQGDVVARDRDHVFPEDLWKKCGARRIQGLPVPDAMGGRGLDPLTSTLILEALGSGCSDAGLCFSLGAHLATASVP